MGTSVLMAAVLMEWEGGEVENRRGLGEPRGEKEKGIISFLITKKT